MFHGLSYMDNLCMSLSRRMGNIWKNNRIRGSIRREYEELLGEEAFDTKVEDLSEKQKYQLIYSREMCIRDRSGSGSTELWSLGLISVTMRISMQPERQRLCSETC